MTLFWIAFWWGCALKVIHAALSTARLGPPANNCPPLSVVVAARNEGRTLGPAVRSLLALDYPNLQVVVVNDRSEDETATVLASLGDPRLTVVTVTELPPGWLGKTHAMACGADVATGELLLFTDADVHFAPDCLRRAVTSLSGVDHLVLGPSMQAVGFWENLFVSFFGAAFCLRFAPERAGNRNPRDCIGIGAFNLVRRSAYERSGGYSALPLHVLDDMALGRLLKLHGYCSRYCAAPDALTVRWIEGGLRGVLHGLEKNAYAGLEYQPVLALGAGLTFMLTTLAPLALPWLARGAVVGAWLTISAVMARGTRTWWAAGLGYPLAGLLFALVVWRSAWLAETRGGIYWRGTFYPLALLRQHTLEALGP